jgi:hypothetical protein
MAATNDFDKHASGLDSPARKSFAITKHDTNELANITRGIYVGGAGDVVIQLELDSAAVTFTGMLAGQIYPIQARIVKSTGTTATALVGLL